MTLARTTPAVLALACLAACSSGSKATSAGPAAPSTSATSATSAAPTATDSATSTATPTDDGSPTAPPTDGATDTTAIPTALSSSSTCGALTPAQVSAAAGFAVQAPLANEIGPVTLCTFSGGTGEAVLVRFEKHMGAAAFTAGKSALETAGQKTAPLAGLGDEAYSSVLGGSGTIFAATVAVRKGDSDVLVTVAGTKAKVEDAAAVAKAALAAFAF